MNQYFTQLQIDALNRICPAFKNLEVGEAINSGASGDLPDQSILLKELAQEVIDDINAGGGFSSYLSLSDTDNAYPGAGYVARVNAGNNGIELVDFVHDHVEANITDLDKYTQAEVDGLLNVAARVGATTIKDVVNLINEDIKGLVNDGSDNFTWKIPDSNFLKFEDSSNSNDSLMLTFNETDMQMLLRSSDTGLLRFEIADSSTINAIENDLSLQTTTSGIVYIKGADGLQLGITAGDLVGFHGAAVIRASHISDASGGAGNVDAAINAILVVLEEKGIIASS